MLAKFVICTCVFVFGAEAQETAKPSEEKKTPEKLQLIAIEKSIVAATNQERAAVASPQLAARQTNRDSTN